MMRYRREVGGGIKEDRRRKRRQNITVTFNKKCEVNEKEK